MEEKKLNETVKDAKTGLLWFKPMISEKSRKKSTKTEHSKFVLGNKENKISLNESLYLESKILAKKKQEIKDKAEESKKKELDKSCISGISEKIVDQKLNKRIKELFDTLDSDFDGKISGEKIDLTQLSNKMLDLLTPFLMKLEQETIEVEFEEFKIEI